MKRTFIIGSCLVILGVAGIAVLIYAKRPWQPDAIAPNGEIQVPHAADKPSVPIDQIVKESRFVDLQVQVAFFGDDEFSPCYCDPAKKSLSRWKDVVLHREQLLKTPYAGVPSGVRVVIAKDFSVLEVEPPVRYRETNGQYRPGYLDRTIRAFYEWQGVVLAKKDLPEENQDGRNTVVDPDAFSQVIEIEMPAYLKKRPEVWKKT